jgi:DNA-binding NarL/FixJ family response regulator
LIRLLIVDDHPAVRAGLVGILRSEPGLIPRAAAATAAEALAATASEPPDVALVDYHLPDESGLVLCMKMKSLQQSLKVVIYSVSAEADLGLPARLVGADAVLARGSQAMPALSPELIQAGASRLDSDDFPIFGMLLDGTPPTEIASVLGLNEVDVERRTGAVLKRLEVVGPYR